MPDCVEGSTDGYRGWDETVLLLFASLLLPRVTKGLNRVVSSLTRWLPDSALNIDETQLAFPFTLAPGWAGWRGVPGRAALLLGGLLGLCSAFCPWRLCRDCKRGDRLMPTAVRLARWTCAHWEPSAVPVPAGHMAPFETLTSQLLAKTWSFAGATRWVKWQE